MSSPFKMQKALAAYSENLKSALNQLLVGHADETQVAELVHISRAVVEVWLRGSFETVQRLIANHGISLTDLAYDCVGEAFARDKDNRFPRLNAFAASLRGELEELPAHEVFLAFKSFLVRISGAQLARLYAQMDPMGAKLHRNLRDTLRNSPSLALSKRCHRLVICPRDADTCEHLPAFPQKELEAAIAAAVSAPCSASDVLDAFHRIVLGQQSYCRSVPLADLVQAVKRLFEHDFAAQSDGHRPLDIEGLAPFEIEQIEGRAKLLVNEKILLTYLARGKVNRRQAEALSAALEEIIADWCDGTEHRPSIGQYLRRHLPIDENTYEREFRTKMEYLVRIAREELAAQLMGEL